MSLSVQIYEPHNYNFLIIISELIRNIISTVYDLARIPLHLADLHLTYESTDWRYTVWFARWSMLLSHLPPDVTVRATFFVAPLDKNGTTRRTHRKFHRHFLSETVLRMNRCKRSMIVTGKSIRRRRICDLNAYKEGSSSQKFHMGFPIIIEVTQ